MTDSLQCQERNDNKCTMTACRLMLLHSLDKLPVLRLMQAPIFLLAEPRIQQQLNKHLQSKSKLSGQFRTSMMGTAFVFITQRVSTYAKLCSDLFISKQSDNFNTLCPAVMNVQVWIYMATYRTTYMSHI